MAKVTVHAGDWAAGGEHQFVFGSFSLRPHGGWTHEGIPASQLTRLEIASEENVKRLAGTAGWGAVGAITLGPVGLLAGLLMGGKKKEVTFIAEFEDGRKMLATTEAKAFTKMQAALFERANPRQTRPDLAALAAADLASELAAVDAKSAAEARARTAETWPFLSSDQLDGYERLARDGRWEDATDYLMPFVHADQFERDVKQSMEEWGFTEEEARYYNSNIHDESKEAELTAMLSAAIERQGPVPSRD